MSISDNVDISVSYDMSASAKSLNIISEADVEDLFEEIVTYILSFKEVEVFLEHQETIHDDIEGIAIDLHLCNNNEIQDLNNEYRSKNEPTDVLTFCMLDDEDDLDLPVLHLGEIVISVEKLKEQAENNEQTPLEEFVYLLTHGVLHLLGMHHDDEDSYERNIEIQTRVVERFK